MGDGNDEIAAATVVFTRVTAQENPHGGWKPVNCVIDLLVMSCYSAGKSPWGMETFCK